MFSIVPLTYSFRLHEPCFLTDLQNFSKMFLAFEKDKPAGKIGTVATFVDKFKVEHPIYYNYDIKIFQRAPYIFDKLRFNNVSPEQAPKLPSYFGGGKNIWILKPSWMSRGRGLELFSQLSELNQFLQLYMSGYEAKDFSELNYSDKDKHSPVAHAQPARPDKRKDKGRARSQGPAKGPVEDKAQAAKESKELKDYSNLSNLKNSTFPTFVIQKYIERPMLFQGFKFDIRVYAVLTQDMQLHVFK